MQNYEAFSPNGHGVFWTCQVMGGVESNPPALSAPLLQNHLSHIPQNSHGHNPISCLVF